MQAMEEEYSLVDPTQLVESASEFVHYPGPLTDAAAKDFLDRFPLPLIINALQTKADFPGLENALVASLEKVFKTKYGASFIPQFMSFVQVGLQADSQEVRSLACKTITSFLENLDDKSISPIKLIIDYGIYPLLLDSLITGNEQVATAATDAIKSIAGVPDGMVIVFPASNEDITHLGNLASRASSLGRVRVLSLIVKLFSVSSSVASVIHNSNLLSLLEAEISNSKDMLVTLSVLELLYELAETRHGTEFLSRTTLLQLLCSIISNTSREAILRSRAMMITGRLLSKENVFMFVDGSSTKPSLSRIGVKAVISAIDGLLGQSGSQDPDECECAIETLGQIGSSTQGAQLLLTGSLPVVRRVIGAAFDKQGRGKQLAALHALGNIVGEPRQENSKIMNADAEENLRRLIYEVASATSKFTPSGLFLSILQQASEFRLAGYRVITGLVARPWCLREICSKQDIISIVCDPTAETTKIGMEARHNCCKAIYDAFMSSKLINEPTLSGMAERLQEAVRRGPYIVRKHSEAQPLVMTQERF